MFPYTAATDAIIPAWAFMLVSTKLIPHAKKTVIGSQQTLETILFTEVLNTLDVSQYQDSPIIIKGCANKPIPCGSLWNVDFKTTTHCKKYYVRRGLFFCAAV